MTNWKSGSLLLACVLGVAGCGGDGNKNNDSGMDAAQEDAMMDAGTDANDAAVVTNPALIRLAILPFGFPQVSGNPQAFDVCVRPQGGTVNILANADSLTTPTAKRSLPAGTITQHSFPAAALETVCGFPQVSTACVVDIYKAEDVTFSTMLGTPRCNIAGGAEIVATVNLTPSTFTTPNVSAYTVALVGDATVAAGNARAPHIEIFGDERSGAAAGKARVRIVNFDPTALPPAWEVCVNQNLGGGAQPFLGSAGGSVATQFNPSGARSTYVDINPLAPVTNPAPPPPIVAVSFTAHIPDGTGLTHCNPVPLPGGGTINGIPITAWPSSVDPNIAMVYAGYNAGVAQGGAKPVESLTDGQVVSFYLMRVPTGMAAPNDTTVIAVPVLDSPLP